MSEIDIVKGVQTLKTMAENLRSVITFYNINLTH